MKIKEGWGSSVAPVVGAFGATLLMTNLARGHFFFFFSPFFFGSFSTAFAMPAPLPLPFWQVNELVTN